MKAEYRKSSDTYDPAAAHKKDSGRSFGGRAKVRKKLVSLLLILIFVAQSLPLGGAGGDGKSGTDGGGSH